MDYLNRGGLLWKHVDVQIRKHINPPTSLKATGINRLALTATEKHGMFYDVMRFGNYSKSSYDAKFQIHTFIWAY